MVMSTQGSCAGVFRLLPGFTEESHNALDLKALQVSSEGAYVNVAVPSGHIFKLPCPADGLVEVHEAARQDARQDGGPRLARWVSFAHGKRHHANQ